MAEKFTQHTGRVVPLDAANVDTDAIIPKQFLQKVTRTGLVRICSTTGASSTIKAKCQTRNSS